MGKLFHETTAEYLAYCRDNYKSWSEQVTEMAAMFEKHRVKKYSIDIDTCVSIDGLHELCTGCIMHQHSTCKTCGLFEQTLDDLKQISVLCHQTLQAARKGIYE